MRPASRELGRFLVTTICPPAPCVRCSRCGIVVSHNRNWATLRAVVAKSLQRNGRSKVGVLIIQQTCRAHLGRLHSLLSDSVLLRWLLIGDRVFLVARADQHRVRALSLKRSLVALPVSESLNVAILAQGAMCIVQYFGLSEQSAGSI